MTTPAGRSERSPIRAAQEVRPDGSDVHRGPELKNNLSDVRYLCRRCGCARSQTMRSAAGVRCASRCVCRRSVRERRLRCLPQPLPASRTAYRHLWICGRRSSRERTRQPFPRAPHPPQRLPNRTHARDVHEPETNSKACEFKYLKSKGDTFYTA